MKLRRFCNEIVKSQNKRTLRVKGGGNRACEFAFSIIAVLMIQNNLSRCVLTRLHIMSPEARMDL